MMRPKPFVGYIVDTQFRARDQCRSGTHNNGASVRCASGSRDAPNGAYGAAGLSVYVTPGGADGGDVHATDGHPQRIDRRSNRRVLQPAVRITLDGCRIRRSRTHPTVAVELRSRSSSCVRYRPLVNGYEVCNTRSDDPLSLPDDGTRRRCLRRSGRLAHVSVRALCRDATLRGDDENLVPSDK